MDPVNPPLPTTTDDNSVGAAKLIAAITGVVTGLNELLQELQHPAPVNTPPLAVLDLLTQSNLAVSFSGANSTDAEAPIAAYAWAFGDGGTATGPLASHTYTAAGTYTVKLTVTDAGTPALSSTATRTVTVTAPVVTPPTGTEPVGAGIVSYRTLTGATPTAKFGSVAAGQKVSLPPSVISWNDFGQGVQAAHPTTSGFGVLITKPGQLLGSGIGQSVFAMNAGSTSKTTPPGGVGGTTQLEYVGVGGPMTLIQDLTVQGRPINGGSYTGPGENTDSNPATQNIYNGLFLNTLTGFAMRRVKVVGIPGCYNAPPGETFAIDVYKGSNHTYEDIEVDGAGVGASGWGPNFLGGTQVVNRLYSHDLPYGIGAAIFNCTGNLTMTDCVFRRNKAGINFEDCAYDWVKVVRPTFDSISGAHIDWWGDTASKANSKSFRLDIYDPVIVGGGKLLVRCPATHGSAPNVMKKSDIHVWVKGVEQPQANVIQFL